MLEWRQSLFADTRVVMMPIEPRSHTSTFHTYATVSTACLFLPALAGAFIRVSPRFKLLPS